MKIKDETGKKGLPIKTIFRESIGFFKRHALEAICKEKDVRSDDIFWVLTVPAIWSEPAKQLMRVAAIEVKKVFNVTPSTCSLGCLIKRPIVLSRSHRYFSKFENDLTALPQLYQTMKVFFNSSLKI